MTGLWLVRHGETTTPGLFLGKADPPLSAAGREEAGRLAARLLPLGIERIVASGLRRAVETAAILGAACGVEAESDERLNEIGYGAWDGLDWAEIERRWPREAATKLEDWWAVAPPGGETTPRFVQRVESAWADLAGDPRRPTAVVAHLGVNALLAELARCGAVDAVDWARVTAFRQPLGDALEL